MANAIYNKLREVFGDGTLDWVADTIKVMLVIAHTPDIDAMDFIDDISDEITGTGYTAGGATLASKAANRDDANDRTELDAADLTWASATFTASGAVIYKDTGTPGTSPVLAYIDFGASKAPVAADFIITWNAEGIIQI